MSSKLSGKTFKPHILMIGGLWRVHARSPWTPTTVRLEALSFMTANSKRFREAQVWASCRNARLVAQHAARREIALVERSMK